MRLWLLFIFAFNTVLYANESAEFIVCYDFGCKSTQPVQFNDQQWNNIDKLFSKPALSAWMEKQKIRQAIALMEQYSGEIVGTGQDKAGNYPGFDVPKQQDCIDESTNTMQYLTALSHRNYLIWHDPAGKKRRIVWLATHWTAVIQQKDNQQLFAVDSWYQDNGLPPYVQKLTDWQDKVDFPENLNP